MDKEYKMYNNKLVNCPKRKQKGLLQKLFQEEYSDIKKPWKCIKSVISWNQKDIGTPQVFNEKDRFITEPNEIEFHLKRNYITTTKKQKTKPNNRPIVILENLINGSSKEEFTFSIECLWNKVLDKLFSLQKVITSSSISLKCQNWF